MAEEQPEAEKLEVGDNVYVGEPEEGKVHWVILQLFQSCMEVVVGSDGKGETQRWNAVPVPVANLRSGMTGRLKRHVSLERLHLHLKGQKP